MKTYIENTAKPYHGTDSECCVCSYTLKMGQEIQFDGTISLQWITAKLIICCSFVMDWNFRTVGDIDVREHSSLPADWLEQRPATPCLLRLCFQWKTLQIGGLQQHVCLVAECQWALEADFLVCFTTRLAFRPCAFRRG